MALTKAKLQEGLGAGEYETAPIGAVFLRVANTSPAGEIGGTWEYIDSATLFGVTLYAWKRTA